MKNLFLTFVLFITVPVAAQQLTQKQAHEDLLVLKESIKKYNPALTTYNPGFDEKAGLIIEKVNTNPVSFLHHFKNISQLCALSNEGHFALGNWSDTVHSGFLQNRYNYLPLSIKVVAGKMYLWIDNSMEQKMKRGDEILEINGQPATTILSTIYKVFPADGDITTYIDKNIELGFSWMYYFYVEQPDDFKLKIKGAEGQVKEITIRALTRDVQFENYEKYYQPKADADQPDRFHELTIDGDMATLRLPSFDYRRIKKAGVKSKSFYKSVFKQLKEKQVNYLVVDLRGNTGGRNEFADDAVPYIRKASTTAPFLKKTISWEGKTKTYKLKKASKYVFKGKVYVLTDGRTYSAGNTLARYLKEFAHATIIGEETGTRYEGFAAGSKQYVTLPHLKIKIGIPRYHILFSASEKQKTTNKGLLPDHHVKYSFEDIVQQKDLHLETAKKLIKSGN
jgi:C-terminal processing protease CtpA/Prc